MIFFYVVIDIYIYLKKLRNKLDFFKMKNLIFNKLKSNIADKNNMTHFNEENIDQLLQYHYQNQNYTNIIELSKFNSNDINYASSPITGNTMNISNKHSIKRKSVLSVKVG